MKYADYSAGKAVLGILLALHVVVGEANAQSLATGIKFSDIVVRGNERSRATSILAMCRLSPDNRFLDADLREALNCLGNSGQFESVSFEAEGDVLVVNVVEAPQHNGLLDIGLSVDSDRGLSANLYIEKRHLFTEELSGSLTAELSEVDHFFGAFLVDEDLFGLGVPGGFNLDYVGQSYPNSAYNSDQFELGAFVEFVHGTSAITRLRGGLQHVEIANIDALAGPFMAAEETALTRMFAALEFEQRTRANIGRLPEADLRFAASQTVFINADSGGAGKTEISADMRAQTDGGKFGFGAHLAGGHLATMGSGRVAMTDRFQLGGDSLRGFSERSIGPNENGFVLGGNSFASLRIEGDMRLASFENVELRSGIFADAGSVWGLDNATPGIDVQPNLRSSVGVSLSVEVSDVPIDLYYAVPVNYEDEDQTQSFGFSLSRRF